VMYNARVLHRQVNTRERVALSSGFSMIGMFAPQSSRVVKIFQSNGALKMNK
jgi:hypothetical protein